MDMPAPYGSIIRALSVLAQLPELHHHDTDWLARDDVMQEVQRIRAAADELMQLVGAD